MEGASYLLCAATALACSVLLLRRYRRARVPLLLWCGLFFLALMVENVVLFIDLVLLPEVDLSTVRNGTALVGVLLLLGGLFGEIH
jgi:hypothetical protein